MSKWLKIFIIILFAFAISVITYKLLSSGKINTLPFSTTNKVFTWKDAEARIKNDCRMFTLEFIRSGDGSFYNAELLSNFKKVDAGQMTSSEAIKKDGGICWVVWTGDNNGKGEVLYETETGELGKLMVKSFAD